MGYIDIQNREDIDGLIEKTLSKHYHTKVTITGIYTPKSFILNPRLNSAISANASEEIKTAIYKEHAVRSNRFLKLIMDTYISLGFSKYKMFGCKYITFDEFPDCSNDLYIMPGNMKIKLFNFASMTIDNVIKEGFETFSFDREKSVRLKPEWPFVLPLMPVNRYTYREPLLKGCSFARLENNKRVVVERKIRDILSTIQKKNSKEVDSIKYTAKLIVQIEDNAMRINSKSALLFSIVKFAKSIATKIKEKKIKTAFSHGDFQNGNIFVTNDNMIYLIDWETWEDRSIGYDVLTFFYKLRYRKNFLKRIDEFITDEKWGNIARYFYDGTIVKKEQILIFYLLEDVVWLLKECAQTVEKRLSGSLKQYADRHFQNEMFKRVEGNNE